MPLLSTVELKGFTKIRFRPKVNNHRIRKINHSKPNTDSDKNYIKLEN
jgi:hypothetical protein